MKLSTDRILTTHTGSLPRAQDLTTTLEAIDSGRAGDVLKRWATISQL